MCCVVQWARNGGRSVKDSSTERKSFSNRRVLLIISLRVELTEDFWRYGCLPFFVFFRERISGLAAALRTGHSHFPVC